MKQLKKLNDVRNELFDGKKVTYRGYTYWANMVTREIYRLNEDQVIAGVIDGTKYATITDNWEIVK